MHQIIVNNLYLISRIDKKTGFKETIKYQGKLKDKPKGWKVEKQLNGSITVDDNGLTGKHF